MTWIPLLLADRSASLRYLVLVDLLNRDQEDLEVKELLELRKDDPFVKKIMKLQNSDGSWRSEDGNSDSWDNIKFTSEALLSLGYMGYDAGYEAVQRGAEYLFACQNNDGSWCLPRTKSEREFREVYSLIPLQTAIPVRGLAAAGYAADSRTEKGYDWLLSIRLDDGSWSSGLKGDVPVFPAGYRRLAFSRFGCRTNTSLVMSALGYHPRRCESEAAKIGLDMLLAQEVEQSTAMGLEVARMIGAEKRRGFFTYFARHDSAFLLDLCWRIGANAGDERVKLIIEKIQSQQNEFGTWKYMEKPAASRWVTFDLLRSLSRIDQGKDWKSSLPRIDFQPYPKKGRRY